MLVHVYVVIKPPRGPPPSLPRKMGERGLTVLLNLLIYPGHPLERLCFFNINIIVVKKMLCVGKKIIIITIFSSAHIPHKTEEILAKKIN